MSTRRAGCVLLSLPEITLIFRVYESVVCVCFFLVLGELCRARTVPPAADGFRLYVALHFSGGVSLEASGITSDCGYLVVFAKVLH